MRSWIGVRGAGQDGQARRERAEKAMETQNRLKELLPNDPFAPFLSAEQIALAAQIDPDNRQLALVRDTIRRRHMAVLVTLAEWQPGMDTAILVDAAARVKELVELGATVEEIVRQACERSKR